MMYNMYRPFALKFLERIGGTKLDISLFYSLPGLVAAFALLPGCVFLTRLRRKKNVTSVLFLTSRSLVLVMAFIPFLPPAARPLAFVCVVAALNLPEALAQTSLQSFLGNVFKDSDRALAISLRQKFGNMLILAVTLATGFIISFAPSSDAQRMRVYQLFFVLSFLAGLMEVLVFRKFREEAPAEDRRPADFAAIKGVMRNKGFLSFLAATIFFQFTWQAGWPITAVYQIEVLKSSEIWFAMYAVASGLAAFSSAGFWNRQIIKRGNPRTLFMASVFMAVNMLFIGLAPNVLWMTVAHLFFGFSTIGINTTILNGMILATPEEDRIVYLGAYNTFVNISLFVSPLFASLLMNLTGVRLSIFIVFALRVLGALAVFMGNRAQKPA